MNVKKNYCKKYKLNSERNNYLICFESLDINNESKIKINLTHYLSDRNINFYFEQKFEEIIKQNIFLIEYNTPKSLIDYFAKLTKLDSIAVDRISKLIYNITMYDKDKNKIIKYSLKRKIDINEKSLEEIEEEIFKMYQNYENMETNLNIQNQKFEELKQNYDQRIKALESILIQNKSSVNTGSTNPNSNPIPEIESKADKEEIKNSLDGMQCIHTSYNVEESFGFSNINFNENSDYNNNNINHNLKNIDNNNSIIRSSINNSQNDSNRETIFKENNNTIIFKDPIQYKGKTPVSKEKCEIFTAFTSFNGHPIFVWTIKNKANCINIKFSNGEQKIIEAHKKNINCLQYFHIPENKDYIISLSENDEESIIFWNIINGENLVKINVIKSNLLNKKIQKFCMFNSKYISKEYSYIFIYGENYNMNTNNNKEIICIKLDNNLENINLNENIINVLDNNNKVNNLDTFFSKKQSQLYLINCNERNVNVYQNPLGEYTNITFSKNDSKFHLSAFIVERNNKIQLFDSNINGIYIWDINNNENPILEISLENSIIYDICLWNNNYLFASTNIGLKQINIKENNNKTIDDSLNISNKIRKIYSPEKGHSIIGIDSNHNLCLWAFQVPIN